MKIRLHEIELGCTSVQKSTDFYGSVLGLPSRLQQENLTVLDAGAEGIDFNLSMHLPAGSVVISFLTDDLEEIQTRLKNAGILYDGPFSSHLGMTAIQFKDAAGHLLRINTPGNDSPDWLRVS